MKNDLQLVRDIRKNISDAKLIAGNWADQGEIEGALMAIQLIDAPNSCHDDSVHSRACYQTVHTEIASVGECAQDCFIHSFLHHINQAHQRLMRGSKALNCPNWPKAQAAIDRRSFESDHDSKLDVLFAVWGCETVEQNNQLLNKLFCNL